jgi:hypothetical protein
MFVSNTYTTFKQNIGEKLLNISRMVIFLKNFQ